MLLSAENGYDSDFWWLLGDTSGLEVTTSVELVETSSNFVGQCDGVEFLVTHFYLKCYYPAYDQEALELDGNSSLLYTFDGRDIDLNIIVDGQHVLLSKAFSYVDNTGFYSVLTDTRVTLNLPSRQVEEFYSIITTDINFIANSADINKLLSGTAQEAYLEGFERVVEQVEITNLAAHDIIWITDWSRGDTKNERANINITIRSVMTGMSISSESSSLFRLSHLFIKLM